jgi:hypothetical protein
VKPTTAETPTDIALGKSISFRPGSLWADAAAYGVAQKEKTGSALNTSEVVCKALVHLFETDGFKRPSAGDTSKDEHRAELLALAEDIGLPAALDTLRARARRAA